MSTKAEERKALEQIKNIIEQVGGADSYIGMAFQGCIVDAEDNIEYDFGNSMRQRYITAAEEAAELRKERDDLRYNLKIAEDAARKFADDLKDAKELAQERYEVCDKAKAERDEASKRADAAEARATEQAQELLRLKAMLFDLMYNK